MSTDLDVRDEFSYIDDQARTLGVAAPTVRRLSLTLPDGRTLSALRYGGDEPVVVFLHGAGLNAHTWDATVLALGLPALAIDLAGHGDSSWREDLDYSPRTLAADVAVVLGSWGTGPLTVVGQSLGGLTGAALAAAHPELVHALVVVDITPGIDTTAGPAELREFYRVVDAGSRDELVERAMSFGLGGDRAATARGVFLNTRVRPDGRVEWKHHFAHLAAQLLATPAADPSGSAAGPILDASGWDDLAETAAPILLVRGSRGFVDETAAAEFAARVPDARILTVEAPHNVQEVAPIELAGIVRPLASDGL